MERAKGLEPSASSLGSSRSSQLSYARSIRFTKIYSTENHMTSSFTRPPAIKCYVRRDIAAHLLYAPLSITVLCMPTLTSKNPATGEVLGEVPVTPLEDLPKIFERAKTAQFIWGTLSLKQRISRLFILRETLLNHVDELSALITKENGKPGFESLISDLLPTVELISYFAKKGPRILKDHRIRICNPILQHRVSYLNYWPLGVVVVISPWNFPFFLPMGEIVMALLAGNAVVFKPSEVTPLIGQKIQDLFDESGFPPNILQTVVGDGSAGAAMIEQRPAKIFFTGSVETGKKIMAAAAKYLIPVNLELGGKDAMIVLPDADLDYATSAALWGGFSNSGQVCASTERLIIHESIAEPFLKLLKEKIGKLRHGSPQSETDLGVITYEKQKAVYEQQIQEAKEKGAVFITGGEFNENKTFLKPTLVTGPNIESLQIYQNETFGPVIAVTKFKSVAEAVQKANQSRYGLLASVISQNPVLAEEVARQLEVGTVTINEVAYTAAIPETPWGGVKDSGFGKKHSAAGLLEFVNARHIHKPRSRHFVFKSLWWFPYSPFQYETFRRLFALYRKSRFNKFRALPLFLWNLVQLIKKEKRM